MPHVQAPWCFSAPFQSRLHSRPSLTSETKGPWFAGLCDTYQGAFPEILSPISVHLLIEDPFQMIEVSPKLLKVS
jgi:hypothetical protein